MITLQSSDKFQQFKDGLKGFGLEVVLVDEPLPIPFSYFGAPEAGLYRNYLFARMDTPVHSLLHEASHAICMGKERRIKLVADAEGEYYEENAVLYLQIVLGQGLGMTASDMCADMDSWGYTFRLGSAWRWFNEEAQECLDQLINWGVLDQNGVLTGKMRD